MTRETRSVVEKLKRIEDLWLELGRTNPETPECRTLMEKIFGMTLEYQALVEASKKPDKTE